MMSSSQFVFLDLSEIGKEDLEQLEDILDEKKCDLCLPAVAVSPRENLKEEGEDSITVDNNVSVEDEDDNVLSHSRKDSITSGISFFVDGGLPEDIDLRKTPPMLSASTTPPPSEAPSTPCNEPEDLIDVYPPHTPQPSYMNPPMTMMQPMNVHSVPPTSGAIYNMAPPYPPHTAPPTAVQNGLYSQLAPNPSHHPHHMVPHTVHIENCHVNLTQPPHPPLYGAPYQGPPPHQVFPPYVIGDQPPMMRGGLDREYEPKRHDGRGYTRGRPRGGRRPRKGRDESERSNSVSSDHSSYSDSGSKPLYKDPGPPPHAHFPPPMFPYQPYMQYTFNSMPRPQQGFPIVQQGFIPDPYGPHQPSHVLAYPAHHPVSVPVMPPDAPGVPTAAPPHSECEPPVPLGQGQIQEHITVQVTSITTHASYMEAPTTSQASHAHPHYPYSTVPSSVTHTEPSIAANTMSVSSAEPLMQEASSSASSPDPDHEEVSEATSTEQIDEVQCLEKSPSSDPKEEDRPPVAAFQATAKSYEPSEAAVTTAEDGIIPPVVAEETQETSPSKVQPVFPSPRLDNAGGKVPAESEVQQTQQESTTPPAPPKKSYQSRRTPQSTDVTPSSRESSPPNVSSIKNKYSPVPFSATKSSEKDSAAGAGTAKAPRKNSSHNASSASSTTSSSRNSPSTSFEPHNSITIYNKSHTMPLSRAPKSSSKSAGEARPGETTKAKVENGFATAGERPPPPQPHNHTSHVPAPQQEPPLEKKINNFVAKETPRTSFPVPPPPVVMPTQPDPEPKKSWSQLFKKTADDPSTKQVALVSPFNAKEGSDTCSQKPGSKKENGEIPSSNGDIEKAKLGALLKDYVPNYRPVLLQPRGLINKNYWCYVNAPLQAILACPSFYQLAETLSKEAGYKTGNISTPFINSLVDYVSEFNGMSPVTKTRKKDGAAHKKEPEVAPGPPFEPTCVYKMLINCKENQFTEGRQQDAEEMLSCLLNGLHDEMVESLKLAGPSNNTQNGVSGGENGKASIPDTSEEGDEWKVQGPKKKSCITRTAHYHPSPISEIFWGQLRSVLHQAGNTTANLQPFNTLPLDIQSSKVDTVKDALSQLVTREEISGFTCPKTNQEVTASNQVLFEDLPRVLILQLKRFIYDKDGGLQKVTKRLQFPIDLDITKDLISANSRGKFSTSQRKFKLFAIVNHEGKEATKGHYVADVYHNGYACWLRYDDSNVKAIPESVVLRHEPPRVPYLLFYRRSDTLSAPAVSSGGAAATPSYKTSASKE